MLTPDQLEPNPPRASDWTTQTHTQKSRIFFLRTHTRDKDGRFVFVECDEVKGDNSSFWDLRRRWWVATPAQLLNFIEILEIFSVFVFPVENSGYICTEEKLRCRVQQVCYTFEHVRHF